MEGGGGGKGGSCDQKGVEYILIRKECRGACQCIKLYIHHSILIKLGQNVLLYVNVSQLALMQFACNYPFVYIDQLPYD
jgi:hypothetical protein